MSTKSLISTLLAVGVLAVLAGVTRRRAANRRRKEIKRVAPGATRGSTRG